MAEIIHFDSFRARLISGRRMDSTRDDRPGRQLNLVLPDVTIEELELLLRQMNEERDRDEALNSRPSSAPR